MTEVCPECFRQYRTPQGLGWHRRNVHGIPGTDPHRSMSPQERRLLDRIRVLEDENETLTTLLAGKSA